MIYKIGPKGLEPANAPENHVKNNLPIGTILQLNGYCNPEYVIVKNLGINERMVDYGARYLTVNLDDYTFSQHDAFSMDHIDTKKDGRIHMYYTSEVWPADDVLEAFEKAQANEKAETTAREIAAQIANEKEARGRILFAKHIPKTAKALIVAQLDVDKCDIQTDYFHTTTSQTVILGWSKNTRDIFSEMRKFAGMIPETAHLAEPPEVDSNGYRKTDENKDWWRPGDEHREKYSMGHGYYLKTQQRYSTGWLIRKVGKWGDDWSVDLYQALAERCVLKVTTRPKVNPHANKLIRAEQVRKQIAWDKRFAGSEKAENPQTA
jgi:hypothetical protein